MIFVSIPTPKILTPKRILVCILIIYLIWSVLYAAFVPPWESPDELAHYLYVAYLAQHGTPPESSSAQHSELFPAIGHVTSMYEWYQPVLGYVPHVLVYRIWSLFNVQGLPRTFPPVNPAFATSPIAQAYMFLPETTQPLDWLRLYPGLLALRLTSSLLGMLTILVIWRTALVIWPGELAFAVAVAAVVALIPEFILVSATVRSDCAQNLVSAAALLAMVQLVSRSNPPSQRTVLFLGLLGAAACLTKYTLLFIIPLTAVALAMSSPRPRTWLTLAGWLAVPIIISLGLYHLVFMPGRQVLGFAQHELHISTSLFGWKTVTDGLSLLCDLFWGRFGWANGTLPPLWAQIPTVLSLSGIVMSIETIIFYKRIGCLSATTWRQLVVLILAIRCQHIV